MYAQERLFSQHALPIAARLSFCFDYFLGAPAQKKKREKRELYEKGKITPLAKKATTHA